MWSAKRVWAAAAALLLLTGCAAETQETRETILSEAAAEKVRSYETWEVTPGNVVKTGTLSLSVVYTQQQTLYAPENGLELDEILVERKEQVPAGAPIATFRRQSSQAELAAAQLNLARASETLTAQLEQLQAAVDAARAGADSELGNLQLELAQLNYDRAAYAGRRQLMQLQKAVETAQAAFETVTLTAPYDCVIDSIEYLYDRQQMDTTMAVVEISRQSSMMLVGETSTNNFQYGNTIQVEYGKKDSRVSASARVVSTSTLLGQEGQKVWVQLDEPLAEETLVKPSARAEIVQIQNALTVPRSAIESENGSSYVQILVDGVAHKRYIIRGISVGTAGENRVVVLSGLEPGQQVIIG